VLKALNEKGIYPDVISGTSAGAIIGALYADGIKPEDIIDLFSNQTFRKFFELGNPRLGLLRMSGLLRILNNAISAKHFEDLKLPLFVSATNLNHGRVEYFNTGNLLKHVMASSAIPGIFPAVELNGDMYNDGGVFDNFPIGPIMDDVEMLIGVYVNPIGHQQEVKSLRAIVERSFQLTINKNVKGKSQHCDLFIAPNKLSEFGIMDVARIREIYEVGYKYTIEFLEKKMQNPSD